MEAKHKIPSDADTIPIGDLCIDDIPVSLFSSTCGVIDPALVKLCSLW